MIVPIKKLCQWSEPTYIASELIKSFGEDGFIWLDSDGSEKGRWVILAANPLEQICSRGLSPNESNSNPFELLRGLKPGHWTGWLSYEAGAWIEQENPWKEDPMATLWIARHDPILKFDLQKHQLWVEGSNPKRISKLSHWLNKLIKMKEQTSSKIDSSNSTKNINIPIESWEWLTSKAEYAKKVDILKNYIRQGDIFQANLSACCRTKKAKNILATDLFQKLRSHCPAPFSGVIVGSGEAQGEAVISTSPERFLKVLPNGVVETCPIKGTRPRKANIEQDADMAADLICSPKDRAENVMIVDLLRNDLGKVCIPGSIKVTQLVGLESFSKVHHLTSVITGKLRIDKNWIDLLEACWPGGSISGAPKIRACQRLNELEPISRGPYCGSFLHIDWDGKFDSNILIRSLIVNKSTLRANAGCGIVADSNSYNEAEELTWKLMPLLKSLE